jgi:peptidyl-prolyl cis-trans isomerase C
VRRPWRHFAVLAVLSLAIFSKLLTTTCAVAQSTDPKAATPPAATDSTPKPSSIVAKVDGLPIFRRDIERELAATTKGQQLTPETTALLQANLLQQQIDRTLLQNFLAAQKMSATSEEVESAVARIRSQLKQKKSSLDDLLTQTQQSESAFRTTVSRELAWNKFLNSQMTDQALQDFFKQYHERFDGTERRVSHILLRPGSTSADEAAVKALVVQAGQIRDEIKSGSTTFEAAAEKYSAGPSRRRGGDLGFIPPQGVMVPQFSEVAFAVQPGEISDPVVTPFGVHLIKVTETKPGTKKWQDVLNVLQPTFSQLLLKQVITQQRQAMQDKIEYAEDFPHFKPGTTELANPANP